MLLASSCAALVINAALWSHDARKTPAFTALASTRRFSPAAAAAAPVLGVGSSVIAHVHANTIEVYRRPSRGAQTHTVAALTAGGHVLALVLLVLERRRGWLRVELPGRPNHATGWIRARHVSLHGDPYQVHVALARHQLTVLRANKIIIRRVIGVGQAVSPTPNGRYYITDLLQPPDPHGLYGPYALGLSAYSPIYTTFAGGDGQIGLHGTNQPAGLGHNVSHGCIRLDNPTITRLAHLLPIGTPVQITR